MTTDFRSATTCSDAPRVRRISPGELASLQCVGGPLHGELREVSDEHVLWCLAGGGAPGRPMVVLLHRSVLDDPQVVATVIAAADALGHYVPDLERRALRWIARAPGAGV